MIVLTGMVATVSLVAREPDAVVKIWPGKPPGAQIEGGEQDTTKPDGNKVAGKRLIRLGNVSSPTLSVFKAPKENNFPWKISGLPYRLVLKSSLTVG